MGKKGVQCWSIMKNKELVRYSFLPHQKKKKKKKKRRKERKKESKKKNKKRKNRVTTEKVLL
jgi:hypothetical protein